ncbi:hypothetical protein LTR86_004243 [Recurvomyces mirabilis]|nr:hypothetical protein LTR86_004243 [Recurvomyces mirabilis]
MQFITKLSVAAIGLLAIAPQLIAPQLIIPQLIAPGKIEVKFRRFSLDSCPGDHIIWKDVNLDNGKCKTFDKHEPPFRSFMITNINKGMPILQEQLCQLIVHENPNCEDIKNHVEECANIKSFSARSVFFKCEDRPAAVVTSTLSGKSTSTPATVYGTFEVPPSTIAPTSTTSTAFTTTVFAGFDEVHTVTHYGTMTTHSIETTTIHTTLPTVTVTHSAPTSSPSITKTVHLMDIDDCYGPPVPEPTYHFPPVHTSSQSSRNDDNDDDLL